MKDFDKGKRKRKAQEEPYEAAREKIISGYANQKEGSRKMTASDASKMASKMAATFAPISSASLHHISSAEDKQMQMRDTPLSATPNLSINPQEGNVFIKGIPIPSIGKLKKRP